MFKNTTMWMQPGKKDVTPLEKMVLRAPMDDFELTWQERGYSREGREPRKFPESFTSRQHVRWLKKERRKERNRDELRARHEEKLRAMQEGAQRFKLFKDLPPAARFRGYDQMNAQRQKRKQQSARYAEIKEVTRQNNKKMRDHTESMLQKAEDRYNERNAHIQRMIQEKAERDEVAKVQRMAKLEKAAQEHALEKAEKARKAAELAHERMIRIENERQEQARQRAERERTVRDRVAKRREEKRRKEEEKIALMRERIEALGI